MRFFARIGTVLVLSAPPFCAQAEECGRDAFAAVVQETGVSLSAMNEANKRSFHEKLQQLKARNGWSDSDYVAKATPFIQDERIAAFDAENSALLAKVPQLGAGAQNTQSLASVAPAIGGPGDRHCEMLAELRALMAKTVENTQAKWSYMLGKLDGALNAAPQTHAADR